nr:hypothetical protein [Tanacetum cinerariifolium]
MDGTFLGSGDGHGQLPIRFEGSCWGKRGGKRHIPTYLAYATGAATPKKARKLKKPAFPLKKRTLVTIEEEEPEPTKKVKTPTKAERSKGIDLLSEAALLEEAQNESWVDSDDEAKVQSDDKDVFENDDDLEQANNERTEFDNPRTSDEEEETQDDEYVHNPEEYVPTNDETNDESNDLDEEDERISEELYGDVNIRLIDVEPDDEEKGNKEMTNAKTVDAKHENVNQEGAATILTTAVPDSKTLTALHQRIADLEKDVKELKDVDNSTKVISTIESEVPNAVKEYLRSSLDDAMHKVIQRNFADIIKEHSVLADIVERLRQQYAPQKSIEDIQEINIEHARKQQVPKETITLSDTTACEEFDQKTTLFETTTKSKSFNKSPKHKALYHDLMESILKDEDAMDEGVAKNLKKRKPYDADKDEGPSARSDRGLKRQRTSKGTETAKKMSATKDSSKGKYPATFSMSTKSGKSAKDQVIESISVQDSNKVEHDDELDYADMPMDQGKDLGISVDKGPEQSWLNDMAKATKPPLTFDEMMHTPIDFSAFVMNCLKIDNLTKEILVGPAYNLLKGTCKSYVKLDYTMEECYCGLSEQLDWNNPEGSNEKKNTASMTNSKATRYDLKGIKDMVPNLWSPVKVVYVRYALLGISHSRTKRQNFYGYTTKMVSKHDVYSTKRILSIISVKVNEWYMYGYLEEIVVKRADQKFYTFKEGEFKRLRLNDIEDMLLLIVQNKIHNLDTNVVVYLEMNLRMFARRTVIQARVEDLLLGVESYQKKLNITNPRTRDVDMSRRPAYTTLSNPQGEIYEDNLKQKRFMCADKLHKFSDSTLISVRDILS